LSPAKVSNCCVNPGRVARLPNGASNWTSFSFVAASARQAKAGKNRGEQIIEVVGNPPVSCRSPPVSAPGKTARGFLDGLLRFVPVRDIARDLAKPMISPVSSRIASRTARAQKRLPSFRSRHPSSSKRPVWRATSSAVAAVSLPILSVKKTSKFFLGFVGVITLDALGAGIPAPDPPFVSSM